MIEIRNFQATLMVVLLALCSVGLDAGRKSTDPTIPQERKQALYEFYCQKRDSNSLEGLDLHNDEVLDVLVSEFIQKKVAKRKSLVCSAEGKNHLLRDMLRDFISRGSSTECSSLSIGDLRDLSQYPPLVSPQTSPQKTPRLERIDRRSSPGSLLSSSQTPVTTDLVTEESDQEDSSPVAEEVRQKSASPALNPVQHDTEGGQGSATSDNIHPDHMTSTQKIHRHVPKVIGSSAVLFFASLVREAAKLQGIAVTRKLQLVKETLGQELVSSWPKAFGLAAKKIITAKRSEAKMLRASLALLIGSSATWAATCN